MRKKGDEWCHGEGIQSDSTQSGWGSGRDSVGRNGGRGFRGSLDKLLGSRVSGPGWVFTDGADWIGRSCDLHARFWLGRDL